MTGQMWIVGSDYSKTLGMKIVDGRDFEARFSADGSGVIINQAMVKELGLKNPVGENIPNESTMPVIGVVENFHFENMKQHTGPLAMRLGTSATMMSVKLNGKEMRETIAQIDQGLEEVCSPSTHPVFIFRSALYYDVQ